MKIDSCNHWHPKDIFEGLAYLDLVLFLDELFNHLLISSFGQNSITVFGCTTRNFNNF